MSDNLFEELNKIAGDQINETTEIKKLTEKMEETKLNES